MGRIPDDDIAKVRDATDVVALISESVVLKQKGRLFWGLCPFHGEKTPSFKVDPGSGLWHCFGCGEGGDALGFLMRRESLEFPEAVRELADRANIEVREEGGMPRGERERLIHACEEAAGFFADTLMRSRERGAVQAREYLSARGFGSDTAKRFQLGYAPHGRDTLVQALTKRGVSRDELVKANLAVAGEGGRLKDRFFDRVMFPIADLSGHVIAFGGRVVGDGHPKYLNSQETAVFSKSRVLYALDRAKNDIVRTGAAVVVEGYTDVIALHEAGLTNVVATLGTALTAQHVGALARFAKKVVYLFDGDEAGKRAAARAIEFLEWQATPESRAGKVDLLVAMIPEGGDPADHVGAHGADGMRDVIDRAEPLLRFILDLRLAEHDLGSPEGRSAALSSAARVLAGLKGSLLAHDYANHVADRLAVDFATVQAAMLQAKPEVTLRGRPARSGDAEGADDAGAPPPLLPHVRAEEEVVRLAVAHPSVREDARGLLDAALVVDPSARALLEVVVASGGATGRELWERVSTERPEDAEKVSAWLVDPGDAGTVQFVFREVADRLRSLALERRIHEMQRHMDGLDPVKQKAEYDDVFRRVAELQRELKSESRTDANTGEES